jgi:hypothetical protein
MRRDIIMNADDWLTFDQAIVSAEITSSEATFHATLVTH